MTPHGNTQLSVFTDINRMSVGEGRRSSCEIGVFSLGTTFALRMPPWRALILPNTAPGSVSACG